MLDFNSAGPQHSEHDLHDTDEIVKALRDRAPEWVPELFPRGRRSFDGREWRLANIQGMAPKKDGSCVIDLAGDKAGSWHDFSVPNSGGGPISTIQQATGLSGAALMERARDYAHMAVRRAVAAAPQIKVDRTRSVSFILQLCSPAAGTVVERYLNSRGLDLPPCPDLLFHSSLTDWEAKIGRPAMVAVLRRPDTGEPTGGIHRTYLADDGGGKADMAKPKTMLGVCQGGVVMLMPIGADGSLGIGEGIESSLAAQKLFGVPTWAGLSTSGMHGFVFPAGLRKLFIFADKGAGGEAAANYLLGRASTAGIEARVVLPRSDDDFAEDLRLGLWSDGSGLQEVIPPPQSYDDIVRAAEVLTKSDTKQLEQLLRGVAMARLSTLQQEEVFRIVKRKTGVGVVKLDRALKDARKEVGALARSVGPPPAWLDKTQTWENGETKPNLFNSCLPFREDEDLIGVLGHNEFDGTPMLLRRPPYDCGDRPMNEFPIALLDDDTLRLTEWAQARGLNTSKEVTKQAIAMMAREQSFHPIREWLESLKWDGNRRLDDWLQNYAGAADTPYTRAVGARFLISAVARVYEPGCKADCALILEGKQGIGKSTILKYLFSPWFTDEIDDLGSKDCAMQLRGVWVVELAELDAMDRAEVRRIKAFISRTNDRYRPPYGDAVIDVPRQCVFAGSVNDSDYLRDPTGGRRFWPVKCDDGQLHAEALKADRELIWAEALVRYRSGEIWDLREADLVEAATQEQADRYEGDVWDHLIADYLHRRFPSSQWRTEPEEVTWGEILEGAISLDKSKWDKSAQMRVSRFLKRAGWVRTRAPRGPRGYVYQKEKE